jgi:MFS family permease
MVGGGVVLLALLVFVEGKVQQPIIPLKIISERTTALAILASVSVGIAMFGSSTFLGQYFQVARGATPTEAGLLTLPMIAGNLIGSVASGILISRFGKWKRFLIAGSVLLIGGLAFAGTMDHTTELWLVAIYTAVFGLGLGMLMQNLVLAVQNTVRATDIGTASASVAFFRSVGGAIGVSVLGAIMSNHVKDLAAEGLAAAGIPVQGDSSGASLDLADMPAPIADIMRAAYGDATAQIFLISAVISVVALIAVLLIKERPLRRTVDAAPEKELIATASGDAGMSLDTASLDAVKPDDGTRLRSSGAGNAVRQGRSGKPLGERSAEDLDLEFARILTQERPNSQASNTDAKPADVKELQEQLSRTQYVLAEQQLQLSRANVELQARLREQQSIAEQQARTADELKALRRELKRERRQQERMALMLLQGVESRSDHGKHAG